MIEGIALRRRAMALVSAAALLAASLVPALLGTQAAYAAQFTERSITMGSSVAGKDDNVYTVSFKPTATGAVLGFVIEFCDDSPLIGASCNAPVGLDTNEASITVTGWTVDAATDANTLVLTRGAGNFTAGSAETITLGTGAANNGIDNPDAVGTFYGRLLSYATAAGAQGYTSGTPGTHVDDGGIALSTANQLTVNARVQEQLQFCVGTLASGGSAPVDCAAGFAGTTVDLGVVDSGAASISPVAAANGGNDMNGAAMVRTNAANGVVIDYFAEQATSGTNHLGSLRVAGASCNAGVVATDQCFNSAGTTQTAFSAAGERFGLTVSTIDVSSSATPTNNLVRDGEYDGDGTAAVGFAWDESGSFDRLASSAGGAGPENRVVDDEMLLLRFAARSAVTTPTGTYSVTSTYVATATY